ncbi:hypothetical protein ACFL1R_09350 [Candidatus Latescibacterota bacterium]
MKYWLLILTSFSFFILVNCENDNKIPSAPNGNEEYPVFDVKVLKWYNGHKAAVSITYDALWGHWRDQVKIDYQVNEVLNRNLRIDFEFVTAKYVNPEYQFIVTDIRENVIPRGIHFFGHGHKHISHDSLDFGSAYESFKLCYDLINEWGLQPKAYAYPYGAGRSPTIQEANKQAGFICARGFDKYSEVLDEIYICPDDTIEPDNWYLLPTICVAKNYPDYFRNHEEIAPILDNALEKTAWIIITYHSIDFPEGWGYYPLVEFIKDIDHIATNDFWCYNMDMIACYIKERNKFRFNVSEIKTTKDSWEYEIIFQDDLNNSIYNQPLTLEFTFDSTQTIKNIQIEPPINDTTDFTVIDNILCLNVIPDERKYIMKIYK